MIKKKKIYLDYAATTPIDKEVFKAMEPYLTDIFGNPSSLHSFGQEAKIAVQKAREEAAKFLGARTSEIIFTSGATESNNLAIKGVIKKFQVPNSKFQVHIITSSIEHHCVLETCKTLEKQGLAEITYLPVNKEGVIEVAQLKKAIKDNTLLISIMYANNEIGTIQPIKEIEEIIEKFKKSKFQTLKKNTKSLYPIFHTDAAQALNYLNCDVNYLGVDLLSLSAHKIYGPKGVGALYVKERTPLSRIQDGGDQEFKKRAGTLNTAGIVGLGKAISLIKHNSPVIGKIQKLRDYLIKKVTEKIPRAIVNGSLKFRLPNNANFTFEGAEGEAILIGLDLEGFAVSTGSACASGSLKPSHVLMALGHSEERAHASARVTLGKYTTKEEIDGFLKALILTVGRLRKISGRY